MKKVILVLSFFTSAIFVHAQKTQQQKIDSACQLVKKYWAEKNPDKIYAMAGEEFKKQLTIEAFRTACTQNLFPLGTMKTTFEAFENGTSKYKASFTKDSLSLYLSLDNKNKLENFLFRPYEK